MQQDNGVYRAGGGMRQTGWGTGGSWKGKIRSLIRDSTSLEVRLTATLNPRAHSPGCHPIPREQVALDTSQCSRNRYTSLTTTNYREGHLFPINYNQSRTYSCYLEIKFGHVRPLPTSVVRSRHPVASPRHETNPRCRSNQTAGANHSSSLEKMTPDSCFNQQTQARRRVTIGPKKPLVVMADGVWDERPQVVKKLHHTRRLHKRSW